MATPVESVTYSFIINSRGYAFLDTESGPLLLGITLITALSELRGDNLETFKNNLSRNYTRRYDNNGISRFRGNLTSLASHPNSYQKISFASGDYYSINHHFIVDLDTDRLGYTVRGIYGLSAVLVDDLSHIREDPQDFIDRLEVRIARYQNMTTPFQQGEESDVSLSPSRRSSKFTPAQLKEREDVLKGLKIEDATPASLPDDIQEDPLTYEPIGDYFMRCENKDERETPHYHYFDAENYLNFCRSGAVSCALCPVDKSSLIYPQIFKTIKPQEEQRSREHPLRVETLEHLDKNIDERFLFINGSIYLVNEIASVPPDTLTLFSTNLGTGKDEELTISGQGTFDIVIDNKKIFKAPIYVL